MTFTIVFLTAITALIVSKTKTIITRNRLNTNDEKRVLIACTLLVIFLITNVTLPYPESLYWFIGTGITSVSIILNFEVLKKEIKRFLSLGAKERIINVLFYSLLVVVINIYL